MIFHILHEVTLNKLLPLWFCSSAWYVVVLQLFFSLQVWLSPIRKTPSSKSKVSTEVLTEKGKQIQVCAVLGQAFVAAKWLRRRHARLKILWSWVWIALFLFFFFLSFWLSIAKSSIRTLLAKRISSSWVEKDWITPDKVIKSKSDGRYSFNYL